MGLKDNLLFHFLSQAYLVIGETGVVAGDTQCVPGHGMPSCGFTSYKHVTFATYLSSEPAFPINYMEIRISPQSAYAFMRTVEMHSCNV